MPSAAEVNAALARSQGQVPGPPSADAVNAALARRQAARPQGTLTLNKSPADRALQVGTRSMGSPDTQATGGWGERIRGAAASVATPWVDSAKGIHQLMGGSPEELSKYDATMAELLRQSPQGSGRLAGNLAGEALQFAIPGGAGAKAGAKLLSMMPRFAARRGVPAAAVATGEAGGIGGFEAAATPGTEDERTAAGLTGAGATLLGHGAANPLMALANKLRTGVKRTPQAQQLLDEGVPLTPGQASSGPTMPWLEENLSFVPGLRTPVGRLQKNAAKAWNLNTLQNTFRDIPGAEGLVITKAGPEGFQEAQQGFGQLFDDFWERMYNRIGPDKLQTAPMALAEQAGFRAKQVLDDNAADRVTRYMRDRAQAVSKNPTPGTLQKFNRDLQDYATAARNKQEFVEAEVIEDAIKQLEDSFGDSAQNLRQLNRGYRDLKTLEKAASYKSALPEGYYSPDNLISAVKARGNERQLSAGTAPLQPEATAAMETMGTLVPRGKRLGERFATAGLGAGMYAEPITTAVALTAGRAATTEAMRKALMGQNWLQQKIPAEAMEQLRATLARYSGRGAAGYTSTERGE